MDAFYAAVEQRDHPDFRDKPIIVGGFPRRGVVASASYEAREFGVRSAMPTAKALHLCPQGILIKPRFDRYREISHEIREIFLSYTPLVEPLSLDEAFLDVTSIRGRPVETVAHEIKEGILAETGLTCSVGISYNKFLAKLASDMCKPNGLLAIDERKAGEILPQLPIGRLWGVGPATEKRLNVMGWQTIGDVQRIPLEELIRRFGKYGSLLYKLARGQDDRPVEPERETKSLSRETTFPEDMMDRTEAKRVLFKLCERVSTDLRDEEVVGRTVQLKVRFADFKTITRSQTLPLPINNATALWQEIERLFDTKVGLAQGIRLVGIGISNLRPAEAGQLALFQEEALTMSDK